MHIAPPIVPVPVATTTGAFCAHDAAAGGVADAWDGIKAASAMMIKRMTGRPGIPSRRPRRVSPGHRSHRTGNRFGVAMASSSCPPQAVETTTTTSDASTRAFRAAFRMTPPFDPITIVLHAR